MPFPPALVTSSADSLTVPPGRVAVRDAAAGDVDRRPGITMHSPFLAILSDWTQPAGCRSRPCGAHRCLDSRSGEASCPRRCLAFGVRLDADDDLAEMGAALHVAVGGRSLLDREDSIDHRV